MFMNLRSLFYISLAACSVIIFSCEEKKQLEAGSFNYSIQGKVLNTTSEYACLEEIRDKRWVTVDSAKIDDQSISFSGVKKEVDIYRIRIDKNSYLPVILTGDNITFTVDAKEPFETVVFSGSKDNEAYAAFNKKMLEFNKAQSNLSRMLDSIKNTSTPSVIATNYMNQIKEVEAEMKVYVRESITKHTASPIVFSMLSYADWENDFPFIETATTTIKQQQPDYKYTASLVTNVTQYKAYLEQKAAKDKGNPAAIGKEAPEFALPDVTGKMVRLSSFRGKYVLLDFWASWCGPCRQESPNVVRAYNTYKGKNFDILSVSLDDSKEKWLKAIEKDGLSWTHVGDLKSWQSSVVQLYQVEGIPATFLLDPKGVVIARDLRGDALDAKLEELLK
jgi:peroxiredoxin